MNEYKILEGIKYISEEKMEILVIYSIICIIIVLAFFFIKQINDTERPLFYPTRQDNLMLSCVRLCNLHGL